MLHQKSSDTHTHTHTLRVQTQPSHSDKSPKQTKTETSQQGSHRKKSSWPEVIRCYSKQKTLHETVQSVLTLVNFKYIHVGLHLYFHEFWSSFFCLLFMDSLDQNFQRETKLFCKCSEKYGYGPKCFGP